MITFCLIVNKNLSSNSIFFVKINPSLLFHSSVIGLPGVKILFPLTFQIVLSNGNLTLSFPPEAHPVSIKYSFVEFFGFKKVTETEKVSLVDNVFTSVTKNYDLMNDLMSFGLHRSWKSYFLYFRMESV